MEHEGDGDKDRNLCTRNNPQRSVKAGRFGRAETIQTTTLDLPEYREKSWIPEDVTFRSGPTNDNT